MPANKGAKGKKAAKVKDLPARPLKGKDAAVKGGLFNPTGGLTLEGANALTLATTSPNQLSNLQVNIEAKPW